jgi:two-component system sensor histidine kinase YesM
MKKVFVWRNNPTIKSQMAKIVIGNLLLFTCVTFSLIWWFQSVLEEKIIASAKQSAEAMSGALDGYIKNNIRLADTIAANPELRKLLQESRDFADAGAVWSLAEILNQLKGYSAVNDFIHSIGVYNPASRKMLTTADGIYTLPAGENPEWLDTARKLRQAPLFGTNLPYATPDFSQGQPVFSVVRLLPSADSDNVLFVNSRLSVFGDLIGEPGLWHDTGIVIRDAAGNSAYTAGNPAVRSVASPQSLSGGNAYGKMSIDGQSFILVDKTSDLTGWRVEVYIPEQQIMRDVQVMKRIVLILLSALGVLSVTLFTLFYLRLSTPIWQLIQSMKRVEKGDPLVPVPISRRDELGFLQERFNQMIVNEQRMRRAIYEERLHKQEIELKFLQSQVNPHFLYNTLDSIYWVAEESGVEEISDMVLDLSRFFRLSLSRGKEFVTVEETVEHLKCYLRIQQFRHPEKLQVCWDVDPDALSFKVVKLMLQPVVENAVIHGLEAAPETGRLSIVIRKKGGCLHCSVTDTGVGMEKQRLREVLAEIRKDEGHGHRTYGLKNLYQRLRILYGSGMRFRMASKPGAGTRVSIDIELSRLEGGVP